MTIAEASDYLVGLAMRSRSGWEQSRLVASVNYKMLTGKDLGMTLPWDGSETAEMSQDEYEHLLAEARKIEKTL